MIVSLIFELCFLDKLNFKVNNCEALIKSRNSSEMSLSSYHLQLPKINAKPGHYPFKTEEIKFKERSVSAASSTIFNSVIESRAELNKNTESDNKRHLNELREKNEIEFEICLDKLQKVQLRSKSALRNGLFAPKDTDPEQIKHGLKAKSDLKKEETKKELKEAKLRKKLKHSLKLEL